MHTIHKGDWVKSVRDVRDSKSSNHTTYYGNSSANDYMREGETFRVRYVQGNLLSYRAGRTSSKIDTVDVSNVERIPIPNVPFILTFGALTGGIFMLQNLLNDPIIHNCITGLTAVTSGVLAYVLVLGGVIGTTGKAIAAWSDRNRRLRNEDMAKLAETVAEAMKKKG